MRFLIVVNINHEFCRFIFNRRFYASLLLIYVTASLANCIWADFSHRHVFMTLLACIPFIAKRNDSSTPAVANP